jgi:hypothetical protein
MQQHYDILENAHDRLNLNKLLCWSVLGTEAGVEGLINNGTPREMLPSPSAIF